MQKIQLSLEIDEEQLLGKPFMDALTGAAKTIARNKADEVITGEIEHKMQQRVENFLDDPYCRGFGHVCYGIAEKMVKSGQFDEIIQKCILEELPKAVARYVTSDTVRRMIHNCLSTNFNQVIQTVTAGVSDPPADKP